jgi:hypothetical protein
MNERGFARPFPGTDTVMSAQPGNRAALSARQRHRHGNSPAAWATVTLVLLCQVGCGLAVVLARPGLFWAFLAAMVVSIGVGRLLSMAGFGAMPTYRQTEPLDSSAEGPDLSADRGS